MPARAAADHRLLRTLEILAVDSLLAPYMTDNEYVERFQRARKTSAMEAARDLAEERRRVEEFARLAELESERTAEEDRDPEAVGLPVSRAVPGTGRAQTRDRCQAPPARPRPVPREDVRAREDLRAREDVRAREVLRAREDVRARGDVRTREVVREIVDVPREPLVRRRTLEFSGKYGPDLMQEVARYAQAVEAVARTREFDVVHAHDWMSIPAGLAAARATGRPLVLHIHACERDRSGDRPDSRVEEIEQLGLDGADRVVCVSHYTAAQLRKHYRLDGNKVRIVHNALTQKEQKERVKAHRAIESPIVLFLGRVTFQKGPEYFLEAAARVARVRPDVKFVIAGSGDMLPATVERVAKMGLSRNVHFTGFLAGEDVERMYAMADVYVMPSVSEPFGITPLEAMALDVPVILSRQSGVSEVLRSALKVDFWDVADIANKILAVLSYPALTEALRDEGREEVRAMRWEIPAGKVRDTYRELVGER